MERENHNKDMEFMYYSQMILITATKTVEDLTPTIINPFKNGQFRPKSQIADQMIKAASY